MNFKLLIILGLALVQSSLINASHLKMTSYNQSSSTSTSLKWAYYYESSELNPTFEEIFLDEVDCNLLPNLIHWVPSSIVFDRNLNFDWAIPEHGEGKFIIFLIINSFQKLINFFLLKSF